MKLLSHCFCSKSASYLVIVQYLCLWVRISLCGATSWLFYASIRSRDLSILQSVWYSIPFWCVFNHIACTLHALYNAVFPFHCLRIRSIKTTAAQRANHIHTTFTQDPDPILTGSMSGMGNWLLSEMKSHKEQIPQNWKALAVGLTTVTSICSWLYDDLTV